MNSSRPPAITRVWHKYSPFFHIAGLIFLAGTGWASVTSQSGRIDKLEIHGDKLSGDIVDLKTSNARIEQKIDSLTIFVRRPTKND